MKRSAIIFMLLAAASCTKVQDKPGIPIEMCVAETKGFSSTTSSNLGFFHVTAFDSSGRLLWKNVRFNRNGNRFSGGKYWPVSGKLSFYAISGAYEQTTGGNGITVKVSSSDGDIVRAIRTNVSHGSVTTLSFDHILAALDGICLSAEDGCTVDVTAVSYRLVGSGTYNINTNSWSATASPGSPISVVSPSLSNTNIGALCVPASDNCIISVSYDCTHGNYTESYTRSTTVTLPMGMKSTVNGVLGPNMGELSLSISIAPWDSAPTSDYEF